LIFNIARTAFIALRRDRGALVLSFILPLAFFSIFAVIFGGQHGGTPKIKVIVVDEDQSEASQQLVKGLEHEGSLLVLTHPAAKNKNSPAPPDYTAGDGRGGRAGGRRSGGADYSGRLRKESNCLRAQ
jgi:ABC-2 type transport system permease protein